MRTSIYLLFFLLVGGISTFGQNSSQHYVHSDNIFYDSIFINICSKHGKNVEPTIEDKIDYFDNYLNNTITDLTNKELKLKFRKYKKELKKSIKHTNEKVRIDTVLIANKLKSDNILNNLNINSNAITELKKLFEENNINSLNRISEQRRVYKVLSANKLYFSDTIYQGFNYIGIFNDDVLIDTFKQKIGYIKNFNTIQYLHICLKHWIDLNSMNYTTKNYSLLLEKREVVNKRLLEITSEEYYKFGFTDLSQEKLKDIEVNSSNDMFTDFNIFKFNKDMGLTGALHFSFATDLLKMRLIPGINGDNILSYQAFDMGFKVFTPYIRDTIKNIKLATYEHDRPFASTLYFGRSKYRLHKSGNFRHTGKFHLVIIGSQTGRYFQELLHKDITVHSIKPVGWENQIANGGRLGYSICHKFDMSVIPQKYMQRGQSDHPRIINPYVSAEIQMSHEKTYGGLAFNISSSDFKHTSGSGSDYKLEHMQKIRVDYLIGAQINHVIHNSTIQDFGVFKRAFVDNYDDANLSRYYFEKKQLVKNIWQLYGKVSFRYRNTTLYYSQTYHKKEFVEHSLDDIQDSNLRKSLEDRFNYGFYGYGTFGVVFNIK